MKNFPRNIIEQAETACNGWGELGERLLVPSLSFQEFCQQLDQARERIEQAAVLQRQREQAVAERDDLLTELWTMTKRIRNAAKAVFGDDAEEVAQVGSVPVNSRNRKERSE